MPDLTPNMKKLLAEFGPGRRYVSYAKLRTVADEAQINDLQSTLYVQYATVGLSNSSLVQWGYWLTDAGVEAMRELGMWEEQS